MPAFMKQKLQVQVYYVYDDTAVELSAHEQRAFTATSQQHHFTVK